MSANNWVVLRHLREDGYTADVDSDGDIVVPLGSTVVVLTVNESFVIAKVALQTALGDRALAVISRRLHETMVAGRLIYPEGGGLMVFDFTQAYFGTPSQFDSVCTIQGVSNVVQRAVKIIDDLGYSA